MDEKGDWSSCSSLGSEVNNHLSLGEPQGGRVANEWEKMGKGGLDRIDA